MFYCTDPIHHWRLLCWTILILRNAFMGMRRFDDIQENLGVTRHVLSDRLKTWVEHNILVKIPYAERQQRFEYRLTEKGLQLYPILLTMMKWSDHWMDQGKGKPIELLHVLCGHIFDPKVVCSCCDQELHAQEVKAHATLAYFEQI